MPVKVITVEIDGKVKRITADIPDGATPDQLHQAVSSFLAGGKEEIDFDQIEGKKGTPVDYRKAEREQAEAARRKQGYVTGTGQLVGGTLGAIAGSPGGPAGSAVGAGLGAAAGTVAADTVGRAVGLPGYRKTDLPEGFENDPYMNAGYLASAGGMAALGEGMGRMIPAGVRAVKTAAGNAAKRALVSAEGPEIARLAEQQGVPVRPGMVSKPISFVEQTLERFPTSRGVIREAKMAAQKPWEGNLRKLAADYYPTPVSDVEAGEALKTGLESNRIANKEHFQPRYSNLDRLGQGAQIDLSPMQAAGTELLDTIPEEAYKFFPGASLAKIRQAAGMVDKVPAEFADQADQVSLNLARKPFAKLSVEERDQVVELMRRSGIPVDSEPAEISFKEARKLRTQLLEAERLLRIGSPAVDRGAIPKLRSALDQAIDESLSKSPNPKHRQALDEFRRTNADYRKTAVALNPPAQPGHEGNAMAGTIESANYPESLAKRATASETPFAQTEQAVSPETVDAVAGAPSGRTSPIPQLRRNYADNLVNSARVNDPMLNDERLVNPRTLERKIAQNPELEAVLGPDAYRRYQEAIKVGKASNPRDINTSGTTFGTETVREGRNLGKIAAGLGVGAVGLSIAPVATAATAAAGLVAPHYIAKAITRPAMADWLLSGPERIGMRPGGPMAGAIGRLTTQALQPPPPIEEVDEARRRQAAGPQPPRPIQ